MSLRLYRTRRIVVLNPEATALEAARAIESNNIGAVLIQGQGELGIITDRDLALRVVARGLDPKVTPIADVMSSPVATLTFIRQSECRCSTHASAQHPPRSTA